MSTTPDPEPSDVPAPEPAPPLDPPAPSTELVLHRPSLPEKLRMAEMLCKSDLLPAAYRNKASNTLVAMEYGEMLQVHWLTAVSHIHVIDGKPSQSAELMRSRVRAAGHKFRVLENTAERASVQIELCDDPGFPTTVLFTAEPDPAAAGSARDAGMLDLWFEDWRQGQNGKFKVQWICPVGMPFRCDDDTLAAAGAPEWVLKQTSERMRRNESWWKYRPAMLLARATSAAVRAVCPEVLMGVSYSPEELGRVVDEDGSVIDAESWEDTPTRAEPVTVDESEAERLRARANALAGPRIAQFKKWLNEKEITGFPSNLKVSKVKVIDAYLDLLAVQASAEAKADDDPPEPEPSVSDGVRIPPPPGTEDDDGIVEAEIVPDDDGPIPALTDLTHGWEFDDVMMMGADAMGQLPDDVLRNACLAFRRPAADGLDHAGLIAAVVAARDEAA